MLTIPQVQFKRKYDPKDTGACCGLDVHKHQLAVSIFATDDAGCELVKSETFATTPLGLDAFWQFVQPYQPRAFAMEATNIYHHQLAVFLDAQRLRVSWQFDVTIINPADAKALPGKQKNDRVDAEHLARYLHAGLLRGQSRISTPLEDLKAVFRLAAQIEVSRTALKNRVKKTLDRAGIRPRYLNLDTDWARDLLFRLTDHPGPLRTLLDAAATEDDHPLAPHRAILARNRPYCEPFLDIVLTPTQQALVRQDLADLDFQTARKNLLAVEVDRVVASRPGLTALVEHLATVPGLSPFTTAWIVAEVGPVARFKTVRQFLSFCGCCPRVVSSAGRVYQAHTTRRSNRYLRAIFFRAAMVVGNLLQQDSPIKAYARRVLATKRQWKLGCSLVAAKIARVTYAIMRHPAPYSAVAGNPEVANKKHGSMSKVSRYAIRRAEHCLRRVSAVEGLGSKITQDAIELARALEEAIGQNSQVL